MHLGKGNGSFCSRWSVFLALFALFVLLLKEQLSSWVQASHTSLSLGKEETLQLREKEKATVVEKGNVVENRSVEERVGKRFRQDRVEQELGQGAEYRNANLHLARKRRERMSHLETFKREVCGEEEAVWTQLPDALQAQYCPSGQMMMYQQCKHLVLKRRICTGKHPIRKGVEIVIERVGPFKSFGNYDWSRIQPQSGKNVGNLTNLTRENLVTFVGGMLAPVFPNGTVIGYPPLHIHHAHIYPYGDKQERREKIRGSKHDLHDLMFQSHGDSECIHAQGGTDCILNELEPDQGFLLNMSQSGLSMDFEVNDVRPLSLHDPLEWYFEVVLMYHKGPPKERATFIGLNNPCWGPGPCTYLVPLDNATSVMWYNYEHKHLGSGFLQNILLHTHHTLVDSMYLFKGKAVFSAIETFREDSFLPLVLECHKKGVFDLSSAKKRILSLAMNSSKDAQLVCEMTKPSVTISCENEEDENSCHVFDKRAQLYCLDRIRLDQGDQLTVIAFNQVRPDPAVRRRSKRFVERNVFSHYFAGYQHSIFRGEFLTDSAFDYAPPAFFHYGTMGKVVKPFGAVYGEECSHDISLNP